MADEKFYWLKLKRDFFKRHDIRIVEKMPNGKDYILFYLKLLLESIDHEGTLRFSDTIPYNEDMLSVVTDTNIDIVRSAMKLFVELNMMQIYDDQTIYMTEMEKLIGSSVNNDNANRQRRFREKQKTLALQNVTECVTKNNESKNKRIEKDIEKEQEREQEEYFTADNRLKPFGTGDLSVVFLSDSQVDDLLDKLGLETFDEYVNRLAQYILKNDAHIKNHYETILKWAKQDSKI